MNWLSINQPSNIINNWSFYLFITDLLLTCNVPIVTYYYYIYYIRRKASVNLLTYFMPFYWFIFPLTVQKQSFFYLNKNSTSCFVTSFKLCNLQNFWNAVYSGIQCSRIKPSPAWHSLHHKPNPPPSPENTPLVGTFQLILYR